MNSIISKLKQYINYNYILVFLLIFIPSGYFMVVADIIPGYIRIFALLGICIIGCIIRFVKIEKKSLIVFMLLLVVSLFVSLIYQDDIYYVSILIIGGIITGFLIKCIIPYKSFINIYSDIMFFLAVFSLITFFLDFLFPNIFSIFQTIGMRGTREVKNLGFSVILLNPEVKRNYGIFWEPGAFQTFLCLALYVELFCKETLNTKRVVLIVITILTTFSTTGYICLLFLVIAFLFQKKVGFTPNTLKRHNMRRKGKYIIFFIIIITIVFLVSSQEISNAVFGKLQGLFTQDDLNMSTQVRVDAITYPLNSFFKSPLFGIGYDNFNHMSETQCNNMPTFTIINWLSLFGIFFGGLCTYGYLSFINKCNVKRISKCCIVIAFVLMISTESYISNPFIYLIIFYGVSKEKIRGNDFD